MDRVLKSLLVTIAGVIGGSLLWRLASRRRSLPCPPWLGWMLDPPIPQFDAASDVLVERLTLEPGMCVLDAGAGPGRLTIPIARRVGPSGEVVALDIQQEMLRRIEKKAEAAGLSNIRLLHAGLGQGQLEQEAFDRAVLVTVLGEIPDREAALAELFRALKPGGVLLVMEVMLDPHYQSPRTVKRLAGAAGFHELRRFGSRVLFTQTFDKPVAEVLSA